MTDGRAFSGSPFEERYGFCRAVRRGQRIVVAGTAPIEPDGGSAATAYEQAKRCFEISVKAIEELGGTANDVIRTRMFLTDTNDSDDVGRAHREFFGEAPPAATMLAVSALLDPNWRIETEVEAEIA